MSKNLAAIVARRRKKQLEVSFCFTSYCLFSTVGVVLPQSPAVLSSNPGPTDSSPWPMLLLWTRSKSPAPRLRPPSKSRSRLRSLATFPSYLCSSKLFPLGFSFALVFPHTMFNIMCSTSVKIIVSRHVNKIIWCSSSFLNLPLSPWQTWFKWRSLS